MAQAPVYDVNNSGTAELEKRITVLERMVDSRTEMQHRLQQQIDTMQGEIDQLRGSVEVHTNQLEKVLERQRELYLEIDKRVEALKQSTGQQGSNGNSSTSSSSGSSNSSSSSSDNASQPSMSEDEAYDNAVNLILKSREYDKAIPAFRSFIDDYPNSQYSANAHYWLGQLLFNKREWAQAEEQFSQVVERYTKSSKRAEAMVKLGVIAQRQGDDGTARDYFNRVISDYPNSSAKRLAESKLDSL
nr:tol-pal system protein YbgF [Salinimonas profundi]